MMDGEFLQTLIDVVGTQPRHPSATGGGTPFVTIPNGSKIEDLTALMPAPLYTKATATFYDVASFVEYLKVHKVPATHLFMRPFTYPSDSKILIEAVIDHPLPGLPSHGTNRASLELTYSVQFARWKGVFDQWTPQVTLAEFLEENMLDVLHPTAAELTEIVRDFRVLKSGSFRSMQSLHNGDTVFAYTEETKPAQDVVIPSGFQLDIPIFRGEEPVKLAVLLRYDLTDGKLRFRMVPHRIVFEIDAVCTNVVSRISESLDKVVHLGSVRL